MAILRHLLVAERASGATERAPSSREHTQSKPALPRIADGQSIGASRTATAHNFDGRHLTSKQPIQIGGQPVIIRERARASNNQTEHTQHHQTRMKGGGKPRARGGRASCLLLQRSYSTPSRAASAAEFTLDCGIEQATSSPLVSDRLEIRQHMESISALLHHHSTGESGVSGRTPGAARPSGRAALAEARPLHPIEAETRHEDAGRQRADVISSHSWRPARHAHRNQQGGAAPGAGRGQQERRRSGGRMHRYTERSCCTRGHRYAARMMDTRREPAGAKPCGIRSLHSCTVRPAGGSQSRTGRNTSAPEGVT